MKIQQKIITVFAKHYLCIHIYSNIKYFVGSIAASHHNSKEISRLHIHGSECCPWNCSGESQNLST